MNNNHQRPLKIMLIVPANNTTMHHELLEWLPPKSECEIIKITRGAGLLTEETLPAYKELTLNLCQEKNFSEIDAVAYGCTAAGFILGPKGDLEMSERISDISQKPVVTTAKSMVAALQAIDAKNISLLTPYHDNVNDRLKHFLEDGGINVKHFDSFYAPDVTALGKITSEDVYQKSISLFSEEDDGLFIACSQLPTKAILPKLENQFGKPVLSSIQVTAKYLMAL